MQNVKNSLGRLMKLGTVLSGLFCLALLVGSPAASAQSLEAIAGDLRQVEAELAGAEEDNHTLTGLADAIKTGKLILIPAGAAGFFPTTVEQYAQHLLLRVIEGKMSRQDLKREIANLSARRRASVEMITGLQEEFKATIARLREKRSKLKDELARLEKSPTAKPRQDETPSLSGEWSIVLGYKGQSSSHEMTLRASGDQVSGNYSFQGGTVQGKVSGNTVNGTWSNNSKRNSGGFTWTVSPDGRAFSGTYSIDGAPNESYSWSGRKK